MRGPASEVAHGRRGPDISSIDYSTDGSRLVIGELSGRVTMLDPTTLEPVGRPVRLDESVSRVAAGPDNHTAFALTGDLDASEFWVSTNPRWAVVDLESGTVLDQGELGIDGYAVAFSPDGRHVAVGGRGGEVLVLDLETGEPVRPPVVGHDDVVLSVTYSPDGKRLLTSGPDSSVGLWDAETGRLLARVVVPTRYTVPAFRTEENSVLIAPLWGGPVSNGTPARRTPSTSRAPSRAATSPRQSGRNSSVTGPTSRFVPLDRSISRRPVALRAGAATGTPHG